MTTEDDDPVDPTTEPSPTVRIATVVDDDRYVITINRLYLAAIIFVVVQLMFFAGMIFLWSSQRAIDDQIVVLTSDTTTLATIEDVQKNRAVICLTLRAEGAGLPDVCFDPAVTKYYPP